MKKNKEELEAFFETDTFFEGVLLQTKAVLTRGNRDWWAVDFCDEHAELVYRPSLGNYRIKGYLVHFAMLSESDLASFQRPEDSLEVLVEKLKAHPEMLGDVKRLMREQIK